LLISQIAISVGCIEANLVKVFPAQAAFGCGSMVIHFFRICKDLAFTLRPADLRKGYAFGTLNRQREVRQCRMAVRRVNDSLLGPLERVTLAWSASRLPAWVLPDHLTLVGLIGALLTGAGFILSRWYLPWLFLACIGLLANWFGDSLDGTLARLRHIERPQYGFFVDHTCDLFSQVIIFVSLGASPCTHFGVACLGLIAFLMAFIYTLIGLQVKGELRITYFGFGPTEIRALLFLGNLLVIAFGVINLRGWFAPLERFDYVTIHDVFISILAVAGVGLIAVLAVRRARLMAVEDPTPAVTPSIPNALKLH
jgi:archaetidylinositol phosphate synthase